MTHQQANQQGYARCADSVFSNILIRVLTAFRNTANADKAGDIINGSRQITIGNVRKLWATLSISEERLRTEYHELNEQTKIEIKGEINDLSDLVGNEFVNIKKEYESSINQTAREIRLEVSEAIETTTGIINDVQGALDDFITITGDNFATVKENYTSSINQTARDIRLEVGKELYGEGGTLGKSKSILQQTADSISLIVNSDGKATPASIITAINKDTSTITLKADKINLEGMVTVDSLKIKGGVEINSENIKYATVYQPFTFSPLGGADSTISSSGSNNIAVSGYNNITVSGNNNITVSGYIDGKPVTLSGYNNISVSGSNNISVSGSNNISVSGNYSNFSLNSWMSSVNSAISNIYSGLRAVGVFEWG